MNERIKVVLIIGIIGVALLIAGFVMGSGPSSLLGLFPETELPAGAVEISSVQPEDIHAINIKLNRSDLKITVGEQFTFSGGNDNIYDSYVLNGTLVGGIGETQHASKALNIHVPAKWICGYGSYVLTIPPNAELSQFTIDAPGSDITCDSSINEMVHIQVDRGNLNIQNTVTTEPE